MISVPKEPLDDLESAFLHLRFMATRIATAIEKGTSPQLLACVLRQEVECALTTITNWREARWAGEHDRVSKGLAQTGRKLLIWRRPERW
jgi:hypothetical protein